MSADGKCPLSIVDMLLNDTSTLDVFDKPAADDDAEVSRHTNVHFSCVASRPSTDRTYSSPVADAACGRWVVSAGCDRAQFVTDWSLIWIFYFLIQP